MNVSSELHSLLSFRGCCSFVHWRSFARKRLRIYSRCVCRWDVQAVPALFQVLSAYAVQLLTWIKIYVLPLCRAKRARRLRQIRGCRGGVVAYAIVFGVCRKKKKREGKKREDIPISASLLGKPAVAAFGSWNKHWKPAHARFVLKLCGNRTPTHLSRLSLALSLSVSLTLSLCLDVLNIGWTL